VRLACTNEAGEVLQLVAAGAAEGLEVGVRRLVRPEAVTDEDVAAGPRELGKPRERSVEAAESSGPRRATARTSSTMAGSSRL
jgi:hypothetical protein